MGDGPKDALARLVWLILLDHADNTGRTWLSVDTIKAETCIGSDRTVRRVLALLAQTGWLRVESMTWTRLAAEQTAAGRPLPRRSDVGQAPNLYTVLDGHGASLAPDARSMATPSGPGLARATPASVEEQSPRQICRGGPRQDDQGGPPANLHPESDPSGSRSTKGSEGGEAPPRQNTLVLGKTRGNEDGAWAELVEAHAAQAVSTYGLAPLPHELSRERCEAMASSLDGAAVEVAAKIRARTGLDRDIVEVRRELAKRLMKLYFKRKNEHLTKVRHALRDLYREFHARITEAMEALLRETHDASPPRKAPLEPATPEARAERARAAAEFEKLCGLVAPPGERRRVGLDELEGAGLGAVPLKDVARVVEGNDEVEPLEPIDGDGDAYKCTIVHSDTSPKPATSEVGLIHEPHAVDLLTPEAPRDVGPRVAPVGPPPEVRTWSPFRPASSPRVAVALDELRAVLGPELVPATVEAPPENDGPAFVQRPLGRSGAPRWGDVGPRPAKVRLVARPQLEEPEEERLGGSTPLE